MFCVRERVCVVLCVHGCCCCIQTNSTHKQNKHTQHKQHHILHTSHEQHHNTLTYTHTNSHAIRVHVECVSVLLCMLCLLSCVYDNSIMDTFLTVMSSSRWQSVGLSILNESCYYFVISVLFITVVLTPSPMTVEMLGGHQSILV